MSSSRHSYLVDFITKLVFNIGTSALLLASLSGAEIDAGNFGRTMLGTLLSFIYLPIVLPLLI